MSFSYLVLIVACILAGIGAWTHTRPLAGAVLVRLFFPNIVVFVFVVPVYHAWRRHQLAWLISMKTTTPIHWAWRSSLR